jgi:hypothetical protein
MGPAEQSTAWVEFSGGGTQWSDLPDDVVRAAARLDGPLAAAEVDVEDQRVRHRDGAYFQNQIAWRATRRGITLVRLRKPLRRLDGKKFTSAGPVMVQTVEEYPAPRPPSRRQATMLSRTSETGPDTNATGGNRDRGLETLAYLPGPVQAEALAAISAVSFSHGNLWQYYNNDGIPVRHEANIIRFGAGRAVVISATKEVDMLPVGVTPEQAQSQVAALPWSITRYLYELAGTSSGTETEQALTGDPGAANELPR